MNDTILGVGYDAGSNLKDVGKIYTASQQKADPQIRLSFIPERPRPDQNAAGGRQRKCIDAIQNTGWDVYSA